ncbi:MAG: hypothetical protein E5X00_25035, partial [Mesorhizobium sp.]
NIFRGDATGNGIRLPDGTAIAAASGASLSAGAKAILDIEKTLEVLETRGVPVIGHGCETMPAFWSRQSPFRAPLTLHAPEDIAHFYHIRQALGLGGGILVANPVPQNDEIPAAEMDGYIHS